MSGHSRPPGHTLALVFPQNVAPWHRPVTTRGFSGSRERGRVTGAPGPRPGGVGGCRDPDAHPYPGGGLSSAARSSLALRGPGLPLLSRRRGAHPEPLSANGETEAWCRGERCCVPQHLGGGGRSPDRDGAVALARPLAPTPGTPREGKAQRGSRAPRSQGPHCEASRGACPGGPLRGWWAARCLSSYSKAGGPRAGSVVSARPPREGASGKSLGPVGFSYSTQSTFDSQATVTVVSTKGQ